MAETPPDGPFRSPEDLDAFINRTAEFFFHIGYPSLDWDEYKDEEEAALYWRLARRLMTSDFAREAALQNFHAGVLHEREQCARLSENDADEVIHRLGNGAAYKLVRETGSRIAGKIRNQGKE